MSKIFGNKKLWSSLLLVFLAVLTGGAAMAVTIGENGSDTDPNTGTPLAGATLDDPNKGIDQQGHASTGSAIEQAGLAENQVDDYVTKFRAFRYPLHTDFMALAKQVKVDTKEPLHYNIGEAIMECNTKSALTNSTAKAHEVVLPLYANDKKLFPACSTLMAEGIEGADGGPLILYVAANDSNGVTVEALNGPMNGAETYVPDIAAGTKLYVLAPAMSESEVRITPDNFLPDQEVAYLQKKVCPITWTEFFERINKKAKWSVQDMKDYILDNFRKKCTRTMLISTAAKFTKMNETTGVEYAYTQKGLLRQLRLGYQIGSTLTYADLIGMTRMLFFKYAQTNEMDVYCGSKFIEKLLNIDFTKHKDVTFTQKTVLGIDISAFETTFGRLNFKVEPALDDLGYEECAIAFPMGEAKRFFYENGKTVSIDHEKGEGGEVREAKTQYYIQDDCLMLTGYSSMFIGPEDAINSYKYSNLKGVMKSVASLASVTNPAKGDLVYLTVADNTNSQGLYIYTGSEWEAYNGAIEA